MRQGDGLYYITKGIMGTCLAVQWLGLCPLTATGPDLIPGQGAKFPQAAQHSPIPPPPKKSTTMSNKVRKKKEIMKLLSCRYVHAKDCLLPI